MTKKNYEKTDIFDIKDYGKKSIYEIPGFFWKPATKNWLKQKKIKSIEELFTLTEAASQTGYVPQEIKKEVWEEIIGSTKLLKYVILNTDPLYEENSSLIDLGFSRDARNQMAYFMQLLKYSNTKDLLEELTKQETILNIRKYIKVNENSLKEIVVKAKVLSSYYNRKNDEKEPAGKTLVKK